MSADAVSGRESAAPAPSRWRAIGQAVALAYALTLIGVAVGVGIALVLPCESGGMECLAAPVYGSFAGGAVGLLAAGVVARRWRISWWWAPMTLVLLMAAVPLAWVAAPLGLAFALLAPVLVAFAAAPPDGAQQVSTRRSLVTLAAVVLGTGLLMVAALWWDRELDSVDSLSQLEETGIDLVAPVGRDDVQVSTVGARATPDVFYTLTKTGSPESAIQVVLRAGPDDPCRPSDSVTCTVDGDVTLHLFDEELVSVHRQVGQTAVRLDSGGRREGITDWTQQELVQLARDLEPVEASWLLDREVNRDG